MKWAEKITRNAYQDLCSLVIMHSRFFIVKVIQRREKEARAILKIDAY